MLTTRTREGVPPQIIVSTTVANCVAIQARPPLAWRFLHQLPQSRPLRDAVSNHHSVGQPWRLELSQFKTLQALEINLFIYPGGTLALCRMFAFAAPCLKGKLSEVGLLLLFGADPATDCDVLDESDEDGDKCKEFPLSKRSTTRLWRCF